MKKLRNLLLACAASVWACAAWAQAELPSAGNAVIPQPSSVQSVGGTTTLKRGAKIGVADKSLLKAAHYLADALQRQTGMPFAVGGSKGAINLALAEGTRKGAYSLVVEKNGVQIKGVGYEGVVNGIATLRQLMPFGGNGKEVSLERVSIADEPRFGWRGLMVDCSRHFYTTGELKQLLDVMAYYKLNRFHWHLTDDQGWRIEIKRYPLLTQRGAWRKFNKNDSVCLANAAKEDMPNLLLPESKMRTAADGTKEYGGYYSQQDVRDIVAYAAQRAIDVVPEVDMPGHSLAAICCYDGLSCFKQTGWGRLFSTPMCPGKDSMLEFCRNVWTEVFKLFPYEYVHIGGDEVDMKNWRACPDCQKRMRDNNLTTEAQLQTWFNHYMEDFFRAHGKRMIAWDDVIDGGLSPYTTVMWWRSWLPKSPKKAVSHGNELIDVPVSYFYLSRQEDALLMPGIYNFDPYATLDKQEQRLVRGIHSCLWGERVASAERMWYQLFPRLTAVAEKAWTKPELMDYDNFSARLLKHLPRLEAMGVKYRLPDLSGLRHGNVFVDKDTVSVACFDPSVTIRYTTDGSMPQLSSPQYTSPIEVTASTNFAFRAFGTDGRKGDVVRSYYRKSTLSAAADADASALARGLQCVWYDYPGDNCAGIESAPKLDEFVTDSVYIPREAKDNIGLVFTGFISVPEDGVYTFSLYSDDGSQLFVDGELVVDSDGMHDAVEVEGQHAMRRGLHPIRVNYFDHNGGDLCLRVADKHGNAVKVGYWH